MDARQLRYFQAVCEHRNVSHAANHCNVAQSAISAHIVALEEELGTALFVRKPRGMEPTAAGLRLYEHARFILRSIEQARNDLRSASVDLVGEIAIGMPFSVIKVIGTELLGAVMRDHPQVRLILIEALSGIAYANLVAGETDMALVYNPPPDEITNRRPLLQEELFCIGKPALIGEGTLPIALDEIARFPLALLRSNTLSRALSDRSGTFSRLERKASLQLASIAATLGALETGLACTIAPKVLVREQLKAGVLTARPIVEPTPVRTLMMLSRIADQPTHLRETMRELIERMARGAVDRGDWIAASRPRD
ncbi:LysR family transcriptional regulator [Salinarimonas sp.]|uniref:LysR family transcriptional regulator n=1 Tax=Salinarimonas sp. TaxID=2766526 RepID=UPI0032D97EA8